MAKNNKPASKPAAKPASKPAPKPAAKPASQPAKGGGKAPGAKDQAAGRALKDDRYAPRVVPPFTPANNNAQEERFRTGAGQLLDRGANETFNTASAVRPSARVARVPGFGPQISRDALLGESVRERYGMDDRQRRSTAPVVPPFIRAPLGGAYFDIGTQLARNRYNGRPGVVRPPVGGVYATDEAFVPAYQPAESGGLGGNSGGYDDGYDDGYDYVPRYGGGGGGGGRPDYEVPPWMAGLMSWRF